MGLKILIIEDEPLSADKLERQLLSIDGTSEILAKLAGVTESVTFLQNNTPDLIFADVHLSDGISLEVFDRVQCDAPVIFTTAYDQYAIEAFKTNSIAYLLKPVSKSSLLQAIGKYRRLHGISLEREDEGRSGDGDINKLASLISRLKPTANFKQRFLVQSGNGNLHSFHLDDIGYFFADGKHTFLVSRDGKRFFCDNNISQLATLLDPARFYQINRKYIIEIGSIAEMVPYSKSRVKLTLSPATDEDVIVSVDRSPGFKAWLGK